VLSCLYPGRTLRELPIKILIRHAVNGGAARLEVGANSRDAVDDEEALGRAWPFAEELTNPETLGFDYAEPGGPVPGDWYRHPRLVIYRLMRLARQEGLHYIVERLEPLRESTAPQLAYAIQHAERKRTGSKA
jgi:hypothetical protein